MDLVSSLWIFIILRTEGITAIAVDSFANIYKLCIYVGWNIENINYLFIFKDNGHQWKYLVF